MSKRSLAGYAVFGADTQLTEHGITAALTSQDIANIAILGVTLGGWVSIIVMVGAVCLALYNAYKLWCFIKDRRNIKKLAKAKKSKELLYEHSSSE